ncbi:MAG: hypothetical protein B7Y39_06770 [Bdellovibrio sp. 28-41-41]|nr:MAG: hypothetical protein B7Y39_06770 [Bdellovibrio sp. 28-41-41]
MRIILFSLIVSFAARGVGFRVKVVNKNVVVEARKIDFPENLNKALKSGFTNILVFKVTLWKNGKIESESQVLNTIVFDLWDELYTAKRHSGATDFQVKFSKENELLAWLQNAELNLKLNSDTLTDNKSNYEMAMKVIVDPISKEKREKIKVWLSENRVNIPGGSLKIDPGSKSSAREIAKDSSTESLRTDVFNQVLDSELGKDEVAGSWVFQSEKVKVNIERGQIEK